MEWSKVKTLKLIQLMQVHPNLWNPSLYDTRKDKQKRRQELRHISKVLGITCADVTKKIQHIRTQYNREWAREVRANVESPGETFVSGWYAYECLHFFKYPNKPYRLLEAETSTEDNISTAPQDKDFKHTTEQDPLELKRDDLSIFGEYIANELRSLKNEKDLLVAKKKIFDVIYEIKINSCNTSPETTVCTIFRDRIHTDKEYTSSNLTSNHIESITHSSPGTGINGVNTIIINDCHYPNFKVDTQ